MSDCRHLFRLLVTLLSGVVFEHTKADNDVCLINTLFRTVSELQATVKEMKLEVTDLKNELKSEREERIKLEKANVELHEISDDLQTNNVLLNQSSVSLTTKVAQLENDLADIRNTISNEATCSNSTKGTMKYNEKVKEVEYCNTSHWSTLLSYLVPGSSSLLPESTCRQIALNHNSSFHNGQYWIRPSSNDPPFQVFCDTSEGWTLIMKIDGNQQTFDYHSDLWSNEETFQPNNLDLDDEETKLASYWTLPFTELRLGMKVDGTIRWITFSYTASSLYSLIADGQYRNTSIGESKWRSLLPTSSLQNHCNKEGFNVRSNHSHYGPISARARLGFLANNEENDCDSPDSFVGFGTSYMDDSLARNSVGNFACCLPDNGDVNIKVVGYIMAR